MSSEIESLHRRAFFAESDGDLDLALDLCEQALKITPTHVPTLVVKGTVHARRGERMSALECFRKAAKRRPDWAAGQHFVRTLGGKDFNAPLRAEVVELFDQYAESFEDHLLNKLAYEGHIVLPALVKDALGADEADWSVCDLGCGTGLCGEGLRPLSGHLVGVDISPAILAEAAKKDVYDQLIEADLVYGLVCTGDDALDLVFSADTLGYIGDLRAVFQEAARVIRAGGRLAFSVESHQGMDDFRLQPSRRCAYRKEYLVGLAGEFGFQVERFEEIALRTEEDQAVDEFAVVLNKG